MLFREKEMLLRGNEMLLRGNEMLLRGNEISFRGNEILLRGNEILFWGNVLIYRGNEMHITWEWNAFRGKQIITCIIMSPPGLRSFSFIQHVSNSEAWTISGALFLRFCIE